MDEDAASRDSIPARYGALLIFGLPVAITVAFAVLASWTPEPTTEPGAAARTEAEGEPPPSRRNMEATALAACERVAEGRLAAPATAEWPTMNQARFSGPDDRITVRTHVDAQNRLGASLRADVTCVVEGLDDRDHRVASVDINPR